MQFDTIISNTLIYDGTGRQSYRNDVGIKDDKIVAIGDLSETETATNINGGRFALCPGFVDIHSHADMTLHRPDHADLLKPLVHQGITTFVGGNCGVAMAPVSERHRETQMKFYDFFLGEDQEERVRWQSFGELMDTYEKQGVLLNTAMLAPHSMLRMNVLDVKTEPALPPHMDEMKHHLNECMEAGAIGMSTGLQYPGGLSSNQWEITELAREVHKYNGVFTSHLRSYSSDTLPQAVDEVISVGRDAEVPVQISHLFWIPNFPAPLNSLMTKFIKLASTAYNKKKFPLPVGSALKPLLNKVASLVNDGFPIGVDVMPTSAGFTHLLALFPPWALEGGMERVQQRLADPKERAMIRKSIEMGDTKWPHRGRDSWSMNLFKVMGWDCAFIMSVPSARNSKYIGRSFADIAKELGKHPFDVACDMLLEEDGRVLIFETATFPGDPLVELSLLDPLIDPNASIVTDTILLEFGMPSHLFYDCFPKFLGNYSRELGKISLAEAIRKCTSLPASQMQIQKRGSIKVGNYADLVLFDPGTIGSRSTAMDPKHSPSGIEYVFINGHAVVDPSGYHPEPKPGKLLRHGAV